MAKLSDERIQAIREAYARIGTYSGVAKELGCSPATVKKYATEITYETSAKKTNFTKEILPVEDIVLPLTRHAWTHMTRAEEKEMEQLRKEFL